MNRRHIAWNIDTLQPGFYAWLGNWAISVGGVTPEPSYPGTIHVLAGFAIVLPGLHCLSSYRGSFDPLESPAVGTSAASVIDI